jgi:hypothetical protein
METEQRGAAKTAPFFGRETAATLHAEGESGGRFVSELFGLMDGYRVSRLFTI